MSTKSTEKPVQTPPRTRSARAGVQQSGESRPMEVPAEHVAQQVGVSAPTMTPPGTDGAAGVAALPPAAVTGTWITNVTVDAMWVVNETRNAYFHTAGGAWNRVFNGSDSAFTNLTTLASQAKQSGHPISYRQDADQMTHEIYLW